MKTQEQREQDWRETVAFWVGKSWSVADAKNGIVRVAVDEREGSHQSLSQYLKIGFYDAAGECVERQTLRISDHGATGSAGNFYCTVKANPSDESFDDADFMWEIENEIDDMIRARTMATKIEMCK